MAAVARLLGSLADEVDFEAQPLELDNASYDEEVLSKIPTGSPLNTFLHRQMMSLLDKHAIQNLLAGTRAMNGGDHTQTLAGYALTLLRCFPRRADDTRMWLHLGPSSADSVSPTSYLWEATQRSQIFGDVRSNSRSVVSILKTSRPTQQQRDDWTIILVFLEMFSFDLKIMDDEEFMGDHPDVKKNSAVPIEDVARLVTFLKNLGFTLYFDAAELNNASSTPVARDEGSSTFSRRFGTSTISSNPPTEAKPLTVGGLSGLTIDYLKGLVTGLLRAIYERDSRRKFLPKDHWLMIDRFDMTTFIPGVVAEEESRHQVQEQDDEDKDEESDDDMDLVNDVGRGGGGGYARARVLRSQEARARAQRKASRKRYLESVAPRLEILQNMPFFIPFHTRVQIFRQFVHLDQAKRRHGFVDPDMWRERMMFQPNSMPALARHHAKIKRTQEFQDAYEQFYELGADLKEPIQITFVDQWDMPEAGIDGGGVTKEFLTSVISQAFDSKADNIEPFFIENDQHLLHPNPTAFEDLKYRLMSAGHAPDSEEVRHQIRELYHQYEFLGRIIGKCLYEGILVDVSFAGFFLKKWALTGGTGSAPSESHYRANINDLRELDESLYRGLLQVKYAADAADLGMTFSVNDLVGPPSKPRVLEVDLIPDGSNTSVTNENRLLYINALSRYRLQTQSTRQTRAFLRGLSDMIQPSWLSMFNQSELQTLIGGASAGIDVQDLRRNTLYGGTYVIGTDGQEHPSIQLFWRVMERFPDEDRRKVLKFVTSTPRGPLLGFGHLNPRFSIRDSGRDENRFPTTSTCVNLLKLPMYASEEKLRTMLLAAVNSGAGFDLS
jgi:ubiquitin-protein ligase E3 C